MHKEINADHGQANNLVNTIKPPNTGISLYRRTITPYPWSREAQEDRYKKINVTAVGHHDCGFIRLKAKSFQ